MDTNTLHEVVLANIAKGSTIYTDDYLGYQGLDNQGYKHELVKHSVKKFVAAWPYTNCIESFHSWLTCGFHGVYHEFFVKHCSDSLSNSVIGTKFSK